MLASASERTVTAGDPNLGTEMPPGRPIHTDSHRPRVALAPLILYIDTGLLGQHCEKEGEAGCEKEGGAGSEAAQFTTLIGSLAMSVQ